MKKGRNLQGFGIKTVEFTEFAGIRDKQRKIQNLQGFEWKKFRIYKIRKDQGSNKEKHSEFAWIRNLQALGVKQRKNSEFAGI